MRICALMNGGSGDGSALDPLRARMRAKRWTVLEPNDAREFASAVRNAASEKYDRIVLVGGDGTLHVAVNALDGTGHRIPLAVIPLGTGNDWARTLGLPLDALAAVEIVEAGRVQTLDAVAMTGDENRMLLNAATGGFAGEVTHKLSNDRKSTWGPLAYLREAGNVALDPSRWTVTARFDDESPLQLDVINVVVANGRTAGGGILVAPRASAEDGRIDVLLVTAADTFDRTVVTARILGGDYDRDEVVLHRRVRTFEMQTDPEMPLSFDGEEGHAVSLRFAIRHAAVRFVVGPEYHRHCLRAGGFLTPVFGLIGGCLRWFRSSHAPIREVPRDR